MEAMVVADGEASRSPRRGTRTRVTRSRRGWCLSARGSRAFDGTLLGESSSWDVQMTKVQVDGSELLVCAVGGTAAARKKQIARGAAGALRILAAMSARLGG